MSLLRSTPLSLTAVLFSFCAFNSRVKAAIPNPCTSDDCAPCSLGNKFESTCDALCYRVETGGGLGGDNLGINTGVCGEVPLPNFSDFYRLIGLHLDDNSFTGELSPGMLPENGRLDYVYLDGNQLTGTLSVGVFPSTLRNIHLEGNQFYGSLAPGLFPSGLEYLRLDDNQFYGSLTPGLFPSGLEYLYLSENMFSGTIGDGVLPSTLANLYMDRNQFTGMIEESAFPIDNLDYLYLAHNSWDCPVPPYHTWANVHDFADIYCTPSGTCASSDGFPATPASQLATVPCEVGYTGDMYRYCYGDATWGSIQRYDCVEIIGTVQETQPPVDLEAIVYDLVQQVSEQADMIASLESQLENQMALQNQVASLESWVDHQMALNEEQTQTFHTIHSMFMYHSFCAAV